MVSPVRLPLACFCIVAYTTLYYRLKKPLQTATAKLLQLGIGVALVHMLAAAVTEYTAIHRVTVSAWWYTLWQTLFVQTLLLFCIMVLRYVFLFVERVQKQSMRRQKTLLTCAGALGLIAVTVLPLDYADASISTILTGPKMHALYVAFACLWVAAFFTLIRYRALFIRERHWVIFGSPLVLTCAMLLQVQFPLWQLSSLALTLVLLGTMVSTEDAHAYTDFRTSMYNEQGVRELLRELLLTDTPFPIAVYAFWGNEREIVSAMHDIRAQAPDRRSHFVYGTPLTDLLLVIPLRSLTGGASLPTSLPMPRVPEGSTLQFEMTTMMFSADTTVSAIRDRALAFRTHFLDHCLLRDEVTGLPLRAAFTREAGHIIQRGEAFTFLMMDLDDFKHYNDAYGHQVGDQVLRSVADALSATLRSTDLLCRVGGDEFAALLPGVTDEHRLHEIIHSAQALLDAVPPPAKGAPRIRLSLGARIYAASSDPVSFEVAYQEADAALYQAKRAGKGRLYCVT